MENYRHVMETYENLFHDVKNAMFIMYTYMKLLESGPELSGHSLEFVSRIKKSWFSMLKLINDVDEQSKMEKGEMEPVLQNHDVVALIEEMARTSALQAEKKNITLSFTSDVAKKVMAVDKTMLERIMLNLLSNAIKFTAQDGEIAITLRDLEDRIVVNIKDSGIGIPSETIERIFDRYWHYQGRGNESGSGIGLSIVSEFIRLLKGEIRVSSSCEGTEMTVELPAYVIEDETEGFGRILKLSSFSPEIMMQMEQTDIFA